MTLPGESLHLTIVVHDDAHLPVAWLEEGWGDAYQKQAAVVRLSKADLQTLGAKENGRVEIAGPAGSVVVLVRTDAAGQAGVGLMPASLYANRLAGYRPGSAVLPGRHIEARAAATAKDITPVRDLIVRRDRA